MVLTSLLLFAALEGISSTTIFIREFVSGSHERVWLHTQHDADLGWSHLPNLSMKDFYGPGRHLHTNSQGVRNDSDFAKEEPEGHVRVICSGDSFTLGYGVSDAESWCAQLAASDSRVESVNMGQVGYGLGQAYLWYRRDAAQLEHSVHILSFITADMTRMRSDDFQGNRKPRLEVQDDTLVVRNTPIQPRTLFPLSSARVAAIQDLSLVRAASAIRRRLGRSGAGQTPGAAETRSASAESLEPESRAIADRIIEELLDEGRESGRLLVVLHLPVRADYRARHVIPTDYGHEASEAWRRYLSNVAAARGFVFIDMIESFNELTPEEHAEMYLTASTEGLRAGEGHLSEKGNRYVARKVLERLRGVGGIAERLTQ